MIRKQQYKKLLRASLFTVPLCFVCSVSQAVSLSTYRIYLDNDNASASFIMFNKSAVQETCSLSLVHNNFDKHGKMIPVDKSEIPNNSAEPWIRFSPKNFTVDARAPQTVRFTLRRKADSEPNEYRSYLNVDCVEEVVEENIKKSNSQNASIRVKPRLVQNIPIIARVGKLSADLSFGDIKVEGKRVVFDLHRSGDRSVYGMIELINKDNGEIVSYKRNVSIYTETEQVQHELGLNNVEPNKLTLRFTEEAAYGGNLVVEKDLASN